ncbi:MAG: hypothetical protein ABEJ71_01595 [Halodesulfurarchaeum sp.]
MDLEELRAVQNRERETDGLQELRDSFYEDVAAYLQSLREERREIAAEADDPFRSPAVNELTDELETAERVAEAIYERRIGKLVKQASLAATGMPADEEGLTVEERSLYRDMVDRIKENKRAVLDSIAGEGAESASALGGEQSEATDVGQSDAGKGGQSDAGGGGHSDVGEGRHSDAVEGGQSGSAEAEPGTGIGQRAPGQETTAARGDVESTQTEASEQEDTPDQSSGKGTATTEDAMGEEPPPEESESVDADEDGDVAGDGGTTGSGTVDRTTVRVTEDIGEIFGVDERAYHLEADDVADLPTENAKPLLDRDAAEELE